VFVFSFLYTLAPVSVASDAADFFSTDGIRKNPKSFPSEFFPAGYGISFCFVT
jgi:hypothetical protein